MQFRRVKSSQVPLKDKNEVGGLVLPDTKVKENSNLLKISIKKAM